MRAADLFAGLGGFSEGARMAGCEVVFAANHWPSAVAWHEQNHPGAVHACEDMHAVDWGKVPSHDILLASPCCQGHSRARGKEDGNPQHDASRATAFDVVDALEVCRPSVALIENVVELAKWSEYSLWCSKIAALGYCLAPHIIDAADHEVPQHRERLFIVATRSKHPMMLQFPVRDRVPASSFIDFGAGKWSPIERPGRAAATLRRVAAGRKAFGDRFLMPYYGGGSGLTGRCLSRPIGTITTKARWALVRGDQMRMLSVPESREAMSFPADYKLPSNPELALHMLGNAVAPKVARDVISAIRVAA